MTATRHIALAVIAAVYASGLAGCGDEVPLALRPMKAVAIGEHHSCGLAESGQAYCWGDGSSGQLGRGDTSSDRFAAAVATGAIYASIVAGGRHTCALTAEGVAHCWGANDDGQVGIAATERVLEPRPVDTGLRFTALSAGWAHTCGISEDGSAYCWGRGVDGQLGTGTAPLAADAPAAVASAIEFQAISAGGRHSCGIAGSGEAYCWGANDVAQLGIGTDGVPELVPVRVATGHRFNDIAAGFGHTCAVSTTGIALCWGENRHGELGNSTIGQPDQPGAHAPARVTSFGAEVYVSISAGRFYSCGLLSQGQVMCWGLNSSGQLGNAGTGEHTVRQLVHVEPGRTFRWDAGQFTGVDAGGSTHACGVTIDGTALCWGHGAEGQLGSGEWFSMIPHPVR